MSLYIKHLSSSDINGYYGGSVLRHTDGSLFKVSGYEGSNTFTGHVVKDKVWVPKTAKARDLTITHPKEGYIMDKGNIYILIQTLRKTRRKGFNAECYHLQPIMSDTPAPEAHSIRVLDNVFANPPRKTWQEIRRTLQSTVKGIVLSKELCITKKGNIKKVNLRGKQLGNIKKDVLQLPKKYEVFAQELAEYNIPVEVVK